MYGEVTRHNPAIEQNELVMMLDMLQHTTNAKLVNMQRKRPVASIRSLLLDEKLNAAKIYSTQQLWGSDGSKTKLFTFWRDHTLS